MAPDGLAELRLSVEEGALRASLIAPEQETRGLSLAIAQGCWVAGWLEAHA